MHRNISNMGKLCSLLQITPVELAGYLHVDKTMVSKWRSGARPVSKRTSYLNEIINYFIQKDESLPSMPLRAFLELQFPMDNPNQEDFIRRALERYLTNAAPNSVDAVNDIELTSQYKRLIGAKGRKEALFTLLDIAERSQTSCSIKILEPQEFNWIHQDIPFLRIAMQRLERLVNKGHRVEIAYFSGSTSSEFFVFVRALEAISFSKNVILHTLPDDRHDGFLPVIYGIENKYVAVGIDGTKSPDDLLTNVYFDRNNNEKHMQLFDLIVERLYNTVSVTADAEEKKRMFQKIELSANYKEPLYCYSDYITIAAMNEPLLYEIMLANGMTVQEQSQCLYYYNTIRGILKNRNIVSNIFVNLNILQKSVVNDMLSDHELTAISGRPITKTRRQHLRHLHDAYDFFAINSHVKLCFVPNYEQNSRHSFTWIKKHFWCLSFNALCAPYEHQLLYFEDASLVKRSVEECENLPKTFSSECCNQDYIRNTIYSLSTGEVS